MRQVERMGILDQQGEGIPEQASSSSSSVNRAIPDRRTDDEMDIGEIPDFNSPDDVVMDIEDGSSQAGLGRMVMSIMADPEVSKRVAKTWHDIEETKRSRKWNDDVDAMHEALKKEGIMSSVMEVFSKPWANGMADRLGIIPGASLDSTSVDPEDGMPWDFNNEAKCKKALDMVISKRALLLIGSPMCKAFSKLANWNWKRMDPEKRKIFGTTG